jgi:hypothetical protein
MDLILVPKLLFGLTVLVVVSLLSILGNEK